MASLTQTITVPSIDLQHRPPSQPWPKTKTQINVVTFQPHPPNGGGSSRRNQNKVMRIDPALVFEPTRKKLSTLEAQRIMSAVVEMIRRVEIAALLPRITERLNDLRVCLGTELVQRLEEHAVIMSSLEELKTASEQSSKKNESRGAMSSAVSRGSGGRMQNRPIRSPKMRSENDRSSANRSDDESMREGVPSRSSAVLEHIARENPSRQTLTASNLSGSSRPVSNRQKSVLSEGRKSENRDIHSSAKDETESLPYVDNPEEVVHMSNTPGVSRSSRAEHNRALVAARIQQSTRSILRAFATNPAAVTEIQRTDRDDHDAPSLSAEAERLVRELNDLKDFLMTMLLTTPVEEMERKQYLRELSDKERYNSNVNAKLSLELKAAEDERDNDIKQQNDVIRGLQAQLHQIDKNSEDNIRRTRLDGEKQEAAEQKTSETKQSKMQSDLNLICAQYNNLLADHREKELVLRKKKFQVETEVENWIQKYDGDMGERQDEYEQIDFVYTEEKKQLNELEERFKSLEAEYQQILEARRIAREAREVAERELQMCVRAATTIQAFWRSFKVRRAIKNKKKRSRGSSKNRKR